MSLVRTRSRAPLPNRRPTGLWAPSRSTTVVTGAKRRALSRCTVERLMESFGLQGGATRHGETARSSPMPRRSVRAARNHAAAAARYWRALVAMRPRFATIGTTTAPGHIAGFRTSEKGLEKLISPLIEWPAVYLIHVRRAA